MRYLTGLLVALILLLMLSLPGVPAGAQGGPTATPNTVYIFGIFPVALPTSLQPLYKTPIPMRTPTPFVNLDAGRMLIDISGETENMSSALFGIMGEAGKVLNFIMLAALAIWVMYSLYGIIRRGQNLWMAFRGEVRDDMVANSTTFLRSSGRVLGSWGSGAMLKPMRNKLDMFAGEGKYKRRRRDW